MNRAAIIIVNQRGDTLHSGYDVLWRGLTVADARRLCSHPDTASAKSFLAFIDDAYLASNPGTKEPNRWMWRWHKDDGRYNGLLAELGIGVGREANAA